MQNEIFYFIFNPIVKIVFQQQLFLTNYSPYKHQNEDNGGIDTILC
ncbi:MAG: hypothetical protein JWR38_1155 [Mucilaginibacter sp.]|nr:hypothetical protein [Mucilaginibacter sp.]